VVEVEVVLLLQQKMEVLEVVAEVLLEVLVQQIKDLVVEMVEMMQVEEVEELVLQEELAHQMLLLEVVVLEWLPQLQVLQ
jgi:hypothetical protein